jgi:hypothetical protein
MLRRSTLTPEIGDTTSQYSNRKSRRDLGFELRTSHRRGHSRICCLVSRVSPDCSRLVSCPRFAAPGAATRQAEKAVWCPPVNPLGLGSDLCEVNVRPWRGASPQDYRSRAPRTGAHGTPQCAVRRPDRGYSNLTSDKPTTAEELQPREFKTPAP